MGPGDGGNIGKVQLMRPTKVTDNVTFPTSPQVGHIIDMIHVGACTIDLKQFVSQDSQLNLRISELSLPAYTIAMAGICTISLIFSIDTG